MGIGMAVVSNKPDEVMNELKSLGEEPFVLGKVTNGFQGVRI